MPLVSRTRATLRSAELGFFGVVVYTRVHTPRRCGAASRFLRPWPDFRPGVATFFFGLFRPLRTSWLMLGMRRAMLAGAWRPEGRGGARRYEDCEAARSGAGVNAAAAITSRNAKLGAVRPIGSCGIGSPKKTMPPAIAVIVGAGPGTEGSVPGCRGWS